ncbi:metallophosphoesterase [Desulfobacterales bacterium HSG16]|nr:metallophosphoesterase [Desulfobacterales bacterium HSG16]
MKKLCFGILSIFALWLFVTGCSKDDNGGEIPPPPWETVSLTILQTTDLHNRASGVGSFTSYSPKDERNNSGQPGSSGTNDLTTGGFSRIAATINEIRSKQEAEDIPVLLFDSGDFLMGTVYDMTAAYDPLALRFFELMEYDAITLGNHEFDWATTGLALTISSAVQNTFTVPIIATNMKTDYDMSSGINQGVEGLKMLAQSGVIRKNSIFTLSNGLKVGVIGLMGQAADAYSPAAKPLTFAHDAEFIQAAVDDLRDNQGAQLIIALSHSGLIDPQNTPHGDDIDLAGKVSGIDIIASGHEHEMTEEVVTVNDTHIFCAGSYGKNLARLDVVYNKVQNKVEEINLINTAINDSIPGDSFINRTVTAANEALNKLLSSAIPDLTLERTVGSASFALNRPPDAVESSMGNICADSVRSILAENPNIVNPIGVVANGNIRDSFRPGLISFSDLYNVMPLGITNATDQAMTIPGYPLFYAFLSPEDIKKLIWVSLNIPPALHSSDYYLNISGLVYTYGLTVDGHPEYGLEAKTVELVDNPVTGNKTGDFENDGPYPVAVNLYLLLMIPQLDAQLASLGMPPLNINMMTPTGASLNMADPDHPDYYLHYRIDSDPAADGVQEVKQWMSLLKYVSGMGSIPDAYNDGTAMGRALPEL